MCVPDDVRVHAADTVQGILISDSSNVANNGYPVQGESSCTLHHSRNYVLKTLISGCRI